MTASGALVLTRKSLASAASPRRTLGLIAAAASLLAFARIVVLVVESYSAVRGERMADRELIRMCDSGDGRGSADFRALCLKKRAEQSAPVLLKALLRACGTAFADFCESMSSPTKVLLLILFCFTGVAAPVVKAASTLLVSNLRRHRRRRRVSSKESGSDDDSDDAENPQEVVVVSQRASPRNRWASALRRHVRARPPSMLMLDNVPDDHDCGMHTVPLYEEHDDYNYPTGASAAGRRWGGRAAIS